MHMILWPNIILFSVYVLAPITVVCAVGVILALCKLCQKLRRQPDAYPMHLLTPSTSPPISQPISPSSVITPPSSPTSLGTTSNTPTSPPDSVSRNQDTIGEQPAILTLEDEPIAMRTRAKRKLFWFTLGSSFHDIVRCDKHSAAICSQTYLKIIHLFWDRLENKLQLNVCQCRKFVFVPMWQRQYCQ